VTKRAYSIDELARAMAEGRPPRTREAMMAAGIVERPDDDLFVEPRPADPELTRIIKRATAGMSDLARATDALAQAFAEVFDPVLKELARFIAVRVRSGCPRRKWHVYGRWRKRRVGGKRPRF